ncbi:MAG TPA: tetratricopeptide repeat protein [Methylophilus sp.]
MNKGDTKSALVQAEAALKNDSKHHQALLCKGRALGADQQYEGAKIAFTLASGSAKTGFETTVTHVLLGNLHKANLQFADALTHYEKSLQSAIADSDRKFTRISHNLLGETYALKQDFANALKSYEKGAELSLNDNERADSYERLAMTYQALNQLDKAIEQQLKGTLMQQKSGTLDQYAEASLTLGKLFTQNKDYASAVKTYERLLKFSKDNGGEYYQAKTDIYLADTMRAQGDSVKADALLAEAKLIADKLQASDLTAMIASAQK